MIVDRTDLVNRKPDIVHWFQPWKTENTTADVYAAISMVPEARLDWLSAVQHFGALPLITWEAWDPGAGPQQPQFSYAEIRSGRYDDYLDQWFRVTAAHPGPVYVRLFHEFNTPNLYPWSLGVSGNTTAGHADTWRYVVRRANSAGATNIVWVWCPNTGVIPKEAFPGGLFVSVVGLDAYNAPVQDWGGWRWFADIVGGNYAVLRDIAPNMPLWLCEVACSELGGSKADWIRFGPSKELLDQWFPQVSAIVWFDVQKTFDWRIDSSEEALTAYREVVQGY